ncbi:MAG: BrnT family toxin [Gemmatimonadota bacterium]
MRSSCPIRSTRTEERLVLIGLSVALRVLVVVHCEPDSSAGIRLISARRATRSERGQYATRWK